MAPLDAAISRRRRLSSRSKAEHSARTEASHCALLARREALGKLRESGVTVAQLFAKTEEQALRLRMTREIAAILGERWDKVLDRHRPHYEPSQRDRILRIRTFLGISQRETAEMFRVSTETIARWDVDAMDASAFGVRSVLCGLHIRGPD